MTHETSTPLRIDAVPWNPHSGSLGDSHMSIGKGFNIVGYSEFLVECLSEAPRCCEGLAKALVEPDGGWVLV